MPGDRGSRGRGRGGRGRGGSTRGIGGGRGGGGRGGGGGGRGRGGRDRGDGFRGGRGSRGGSRGGRGGRGGRGFVTPRDDYGSVYNRRRDDDLNNDDDDGEPFDYQADRKARRKADKVSRKRARVDAAQQWTERRRTARVESAAARAAREEERRRGNKVPSAKMTSTRRGTSGTQVTTPGAAPPKKALARTPAATRTAIAKDGRKASAVGKANGKPSATRAAAAAAAASVVGGRKRVRFTDEDEDEDEDEEEDDDDYYDEDDEGDDDISDSQEYDDEEEDDEEEDEFDDEDEEDDDGEGSEDEEDMTAATAAALLVPRTPSAEAIPAAVRVSTARCVNKLTMSNVVDLTREASILLEGSGGSTGATRATILAALMTQVDKLCSADAGLLTQTNTMPFAGLLRGLQLLHGAQLGAELVERLCWSLHDHLAAAEESAAGNLSMVLAQLYLLHGVDATLAVSVLHDLLKRSCVTTTIANSNNTSSSSTSSSSSSSSSGRALSEVALCAASCGLTMMRTCGEKIAKEAPAEMTRCLAEAEQFAGRMRGYGVVGSARFQALVEVMKDIAAGHTKRGRRSTTEADAPVERMLDDLCTVLPGGGGGKAGKDTTTTLHRTQRRIVQTSNALQGLTWAQVASVSKPPRWYSPGVMASESENEDEKEEGQCYRANSSDDDDEDEEDDNSDDDGSNDSGDEAENAYALKQAQIRRMRGEERAIAGQHLNTEHKREIFKSVASATDDLECFTMLMQRDPAFTRFHDVCAVLIQCCCQERRYNPYYTQVLERFCSTKKACTKTLQFALWDRFKSIRIDAAPDVTAYVNLACTVASLLEAGTFRLSLLRGLDIESTNKTIGLFTRVLLLRVIMQLSAGRLTALFFGGDGLSVHEFSTDTSSFRACLQKFMNNYFIDEAVAGRWLPAFYDVVAAGTAFDVHGSGGGGGGPVMVTGENDEEEERSRRLNRNAMRATSSLLPQDPNSSGSRSGGGRRGTGGAAAAAGAAVDDEESKLAQFMIRVRVAYRALKQGVS